MQDPIPQALWTVGFVGPVVDQWIRKVFFH